jgi:hypothetical protein
MSELIKLALFRDANNPKEFFWKQFCNSHGNLKFGKVKITKIETRLEKIFRTGFQKITVRTLEESLATLRTLGSILPRSLKEYDLQPQPLRNVSQPAREPFHGTIQAHKPILVTLHPSYVLCVWLFLPYLSRDKVGYRQEFIP